MVINHNLSSMFASRMEAINAKGVQGSIEKLSSGQRINKASDDAAGLAVSEKLRSQIRGLNQASKNVQDGVSFIQVASGYLAETVDILQRIRELSVQSANGVYTDEDRAMIQVEVSQLVAEVDRIASHAQFNGMNMLTGRFAKDSSTAMTFHIGANIDQNISVYIGTMTSEALGLKSDSSIISVSDPESSNSAIATVDEALKSVNKQRADLGAYQNRLEFAQKGVNIAAENTQASESRIRDTDMAAAVVEFTKDSILSQASVAMLSQANAQSANVLSLLK